MSTLFGPRYRPRRTGFGWWAITKGEVNGNPAVPTRAEAEQACYWLNLARWAGNA